jgi:hypothetical protein
MLAATDEYRRPIKSVYRSGITHACHFRPDHLRASLKPLAEWQPLSDEAQAYQRFYGRFPRARCLARLGRFEVDGYELVSQLLVAGKGEGDAVCVARFYDHTGLYRHVIEWALDQGLL